MKLNINFLNKFKKPGLSGTATNKAPKAPKTSKTKVDLHPELALVHSSSQWKMWLLIILAIVVLLIVLAGLSGQSQLQRLLGDHQKVLQSDFNQQNDVLAQLQQVVTQNQQTVTQSVQQIATQAQTNQQALLQAINQQQAQNKTITTAVGQLQQQMQTLQKTVTTDAAATKPASTVKTPPQKISPDYHIFAVEPYGVVIANNQGQYQIARIGKQLDIGVITAITADTVQAGDWTIIAKASTPTPPLAAPAAAVVAPVVNDVPASAVYVNS